MKRKPFHLSYPGSQTDRPPFLQYRPVPLRHGIHRRQRQPVYPCHTVQKATFRANIPQRTSFPDTCRTLQKEEPPDRIPSHTSRSVRTPRNPGTYRSSCFWHCSTSTSPFALLPDFADIKEFDIIRINLIESVKIAPGFFSVEEHESKMVKSCLL